MNEYSSIFYTKYFIFMKHHNYYLFFNKHANFELLILRFILSTPFISHSKPGCYSLFFGTEHFLSYWLLYCHNHVGQAYDKFYYLLNKQLLLLFVKLDSSDLLVSFISFIAVLLLLHNKLLYRSHDSSHNPLQTKYPQLFLGCFLY